MTDRGGTRDREVAGSPLAAPDTTYLEAAATTADDLAALAPQVTVDVRADVEATDPRLDADVVAWFAENCPLPWLRLPGPVRATSLVKRKAYMTELLTFIALHPHGVTGRGRRSVRHHPGQGPRVRAPRARMARHQPAHR